ncbi:FKBP-type peptidyl-prolyl cis-trans isomerase [Sphingomonas sp. GlSt437]|uniref:FKBP-type peptidyl-prolyl cis-trans isomerase n=1 Tax=Sphingomonas sp. GlSt437 TaxID=3389970 RepID=UPI003A8565B8
MSVTAVPIPPTRRGILSLLWLGIAAAVAIAAWLAMIGAAPVIGAKGTNEDFLAYNRTLPGVVETPSGLQYKVLKKGDDTKTPGDTDVAGVLYAGHLRDGTEFDRSQQVVPFPLSGGAIKGFSEGLKLMPKGSVYRFWIKPDLAYGVASPSPKVPPNSLLIFDVQMAGFIDQGVYRQLQAQQMQQMQQQQGGAGGAPRGAAPPPPPAGQ